MTREQWQQLKDVLDQALQVPTDEQPAFLDRACASDKDLRREVESLLSASDEVRTSFLQSAGSPVAIKPGTRLGDYEVQRLIGSGGMGEVYRAHDMRLKRDVAVKVLPQFVSNDPDRLRRFEQEARAAAALNHPNILGVHQMGTYEGAPYLVSELLEGDTLREQLVRGPLPVRKAIDLAVQIARGLAAAQEKGVTHRDLKPENVFITKDGRVKILDFGLAKLTQIQKHSAHTAPTVGIGTEPGVVMGTVGYMSPEQVRGQTADHRSDIFAFGAILYEMFSGKRAFQKPTSAETMAAILNEDPPSISQITLTVPPALQRVVHRCLEKNPEQRFQSASDLAFALEALSDSGSANAITTGVKSRAYLKWAVVTVACVALLGTFIVWWISQSPVPVVTAVTQLSNDGVPKIGPLVTDGTRIYFDEGATGTWKVAQVAVTGGQTSVIETRVSDPQIMDLAADGSSLLVAVGGFNDPVYPLWSIPLPSGEPRRLGDIRAQDARLLPDGRVAFARATEVFVAEKDGSNVRKLLAGPGNVWCPTSSPDGKYFAFASYVREESSSPIFKAGADGTGMVKLLAGADVGAPGASPSCAVWTPDEQYLLFHIGRSRTRNDIWVLPLSRGIFRHRAAAIQLTNGPLSYADPISSRDGKRIFAIGSQGRGELVRYDSKSKEFVPFLSGISAIDPTFSRDGKWVAYTSYPDHTLWRSRTDGTDRLQLTYPPMEVSYPFISPDGKQVSFSTHPGQIYVIAMDGSSLRRIADKHSGAAAWSPDSGMLDITEFIEGKHAGEHGSFELRMFDLRTGKSSVVPGSQGMIGGGWIDENTLVAGTEDTTKLMKLDFRTGKWSELVSGALVNWEFSLDSQYVYYTTGGTEPKAMRIRLADGRIEEITSLKDLRRVVDPVDENTQISVAPDGSPVFTRDIGTQEIYALDVKWP